jgi:hypothetical protein
VDSVIIKFSILTNTSFSRLLFVLLVALLLHLGKVTMSVLHVHGIRMETVNARLNLRPSRSRLTKATGEHR